MNRFMILPVLVLCSAAEVHGGTSEWVDDQGVVSITDNPALTPSQCRGKALKVEDVTSRDPNVLQDLMEEVEKPSQDKSWTPQPVKAADSEQGSPAIPGRQQEIKGHLGGDQTDPRPQSVDQSLTVPLGKQQDIKGHLGGDQTDPTPPSMSQPLPVPLGDQPKSMPSGMEQPKSMPQGDQPKQMPAGMEQPTPMK